MVFSQDRNVSMKARKSTTRVGRWRTSCSVITYALWEKPYCGFSTLRMYSLFVHLEFGCIWSPGIGIAHSVVALLNYSVLAFSPSAYILLNQSQLQSIHSFTKTHSYKDQSKNWQHIELHDSCMLSFPNWVNAANTRNSKIPPNSLSYHAGKTKVKSSTWFNSG